DHLGTVAYVQFISPHKVHKNDQILTIQPSKTLLHLQSPLPPTILHPNTKPQHQPPILNSQKPQHNSLLKLQHLH
ncbi:glycine cleavage system protein H, partial [Staphylococcus pasteuri]|uniref:glycine cleavage system protein H n=1 Tax=Staphylococcus pasteuri TaxID=45972 RepID=UPI0012B70BBB